MERQARRRGIQDRRSPGRETKRRRSTSGDPSRSPNFSACPSFPSVRLISLQKNEGLEQLDALPEGMKVETLGDDYDAGDDAFLDAAAVMETWTSSSAPTPRSRILRARLAGRLGGAEKRSRLALDAGSPRQPLVSDDASVPPADARRLAGRVFRNRRGVARADRRAAGATHASAKINPALSVMPPDDRSRLSLRETSNSRRIRRPRLTPPMPQTQRPWRPPNGAPKGEIPSRSAPRV